MSDEFAFPIPDDILSRYLPADMISDLRIVAGLNEDSALAIADALRGEGGITSEERLQQIVGQHTEDKDKAESVATALENLRAESVPRIVAAISKWQQLNDERRQQFPDEALANLKRNLGILIQDYPGLSLMRKGKRLLRDTGNEIEDALIICDVRPIFDQNRNRVEGFVALANLRIRYVKQHGERDTFEIALTEDELVTLIEEGKKALHKLEVLKTMIVNLVR